MAPSADSLYSSHHLEMQTAFNYWRHVLQLISMKRMTWKKIINNLVFAVNIKANRLYSQECIPVGCVPSATVAVCFRGVSTPRQSIPPHSRHPPPPPGSCKACVDTTCNACWDSTPPVNRIIDTCKNITFSTSLRTVKSMHDDPF